MKTQKRPWTRAEKWFGVLTLLAVAALGVWGWIDSRPTPPKLDLPKGAYIRGFLLSPDQNYLASQAVIFHEDKLGNSIDDGAVVLWDARTLKQQRIFRTSQRIEIFCLSTGADQIGILNAAQNVFEWRDRGTQKLLWSFAVPKPYLQFRRLLFLKKRSLIWLSTSGTSRNFLLSARSGTIVHQWDDDVGGYSTPAVSPDETIMAHHQVRRALSGELKSSFLALQNISDGRTLRRFKVAPYSYTPLFSPQGRSLFLLTSPDVIASNIANNVVRCLDSRTGQQIWSFDALHVASDINPWRRYRLSKLAGSSEWEPYDFVEFSAIAISPDGATLAVMRGIDTTIYLLDARTGQQRRTLSFPLGKAETGSYDLGNNLLFAPDGKHLFARTQDSIFAWDLTAK